MDDPMLSGALQAIIQRYLQGDISAPIAAMELLLETQDFRVVEQVLPSLHREPARLAELSSLLAQHSAGCSTISSLLRSGLDCSEPAGSAHEALTRTRRLFDYSVSHNEEASVALYSLGSPELLARATDEVVSVLESWGVLGSHRDALEIGCGIGRFLNALAPRLRTLVGTDVSQKMIEVAKRRVASRSNVQAELTSGLDLSKHSAASFDLVYSVDTFPYLVQAGRSLVETHFHDIFRVLVPHGDFVLFNYAYGSSRACNARDVAELASAAGLVVKRLDETPFRLWNGVAFHLQRPL